MPIGCRVLPLRNHALFSQGKGVIGRQGRYVYSLAYNGFQGSETAKENPTHELPGGLFLL